MTPNDLNLKLILNQKIKQSSLEKSKALLKPNPLPWQPEMK